MYQLTKNNLKSESGNKSDTKDSFYQDFQKHRKQYQTKTKAFDYRKWLQEQEDYKSRVKLVLHDLQNEKMAEAVEEYKSLVAQEGFSLERCLEKEDFMDFGFWLSEELLSNGDYKEAENILEKIITSELQKPYFKHFFCEVLALKKRVTKQRSKSFNLDEQTFMA